MFAGFLNQSPPLTMVWTVENDQKRIKMRTMTENVADACVSSIHIGFKLRHNAQFYPYRTFTNCKYGQSKMHQNGSVDANRSDPCVFDNSESAYFYFSALFRPFRLVEFMGNIPYLLEKMPECMTSVTEGVWDSLRCSVCKTCTMESRNFWRLKKKRWPPKHKWWWSWSLWTSEIRPYGHGTSCISETCDFLINTHYKNEVCFEM